MSLPQSDSRPVAALLIELLDLEEGALSFRLDSLRAESPELAAELERLLAADRAADGPLERARALVASSAGRQLAGDPPRALERVGSWRLVRRLGAGGMGEVWLGERVEGGFTQEAAIKLVRAGFGSEQVDERFRLERQVLARLSHPSIAALLDGGVAADGRPWFAMELVVGEPITDYAANRSLGVEARLALLVAVGVAVDFAHRALIVHRDLKPSNILVGADGRPKLLDFGLAKLLEPELDPHLTRTEMRALTPAYAAPEQVLGEPITVATDVYALGVLLYELLTGELPHRREKREPMALAEEVSRESVERPSSRVRRTSAVAPGGERARRARRLEGDLDTIVLKALAREPERRYPSSAALVGDLERFLSGRPIAARPDTIGYRVGKFVRRHRLGVAAASLVALSLVGGLSAALVSAARARAEAARANAEASRADAEAKKARSESERARRMKDFLLSVFQEASPTQRKRGEPLTLAQLLDAAERRIDTELADDPLLQADLWDDLGETRASSGELEAATALIEKALATKRAHLGADDPSIAESLVNRAAIATLGEPDAQRALAALDEAIRILRAAGLADAEPAVAASINRVHVLLLLERNAEALVEAGRARELTLRWWGADSPDTAMQLYSVGQISKRLGRFDAARAEFEQCLTELERVVGKDHALAIHPLSALADLDQLQGRLEAAIASHERALAVARLRLPADHSRRLGIERDLAELRKKIAERR